MCVLVKDCIVRSTRAGDIVVVVEHVRAEENSAETLTLLVFDQAAASAANTVARYYAKAEGHSQDETHAMELATRRAKSRTEPLNHAKLRAVHAMYKRDLMGEATEQQPGEQDAELRQKVSQLMGKSARIKLYFCENNEETCEMVDVVVCSVVGSAVKVALAFIRNGRPERRVMSADRAFELMPAPEVFISVDFVASETLGYLKCLPKSKAAHSVNQLVSADEVVQLVEGLGFSCPQRNTPIASANVQARAVRAAFTLDDAILKAQGSSISLPYLKSRQR